MQVGDWSHGGEWPRGVWLAGPATSLRLGRVVRAALSHADALIAGFVC